MKTLHQVHVKDGDRIHWFDEVFESREDAVKAIERHKRAYNWAVEYYICKVEAEVYWSK